MKLEQTVAPTVEPITLTEAKLHVKQDGSDDDDLITNLIVAAREWVEDYTSRQLCTATWKLVLDAFPDEIVLPRPPLQSVSSIKYNDSDGTEQTLDTSEYHVDIVSEPGRVIEEYSKTWPTTQAYEDAVTITYVAGYGAAADVPQAIKQALLLLVANWYENREAYADRRLQRIDFAVKSILSPYRILNI